MAGSLLGAVTAAATNLRTLVVVVLGTLLAGRPRVLAAWVGGSALLSLPLVALFVNWYFVS